MCLNQNRLIYSKNIDDNNSLHNTFVLQEEYAKEKLAWKKIDFADNTDCLDLIGKKPNGILQILDDESNFPKVNEYNKINIHDSAVVKMTFTTCLYSDETYSVLYESCQC